MRLNLTFSPIAKCFLAAGLLSLGACAHKASPPPTTQPPVAQTPAPVGDATAPPPASVDQAVLDRVKAMSEKLAGAKTLSYHARSSFEVPTNTGQFVTHFAESTVILARPDRLFAAVNGDLHNFHLFYDGKKVTAFDPEKKLFASAQAPGTIDAFLPFLEETAGIDFPSADLLTANPFEALTKGMTHAIYVGIANVNGVLTDHFAFMGPASNWELWVETGDNPLPRRVAVTYKTEPNFPRFQVEFLDWNLNPGLSPNQFSFTPPKGAKPIQFKPTAN